jgi:hypothetical protein
VPKKCTENILLAAAGYIDSCGFSLRKSQDARRREVARGYRYLYLAESVREDGKVRQRLIRPLGRKDQLVASGQLERLLESIG